jgi:hypothetical protein
MWLLYRVKLTYALMVITSRIMSASKNKNIYNRILNSVCDVESLTSVGMVVNLELIMAC